MLASGSTIRSTELWEMSRSCQRATSSRPATRYPRSTRARPERRSAVIGFRLWGIADEPFWPVAKGSSTSPTSVRCRSLTSVARASIVVPSAPGASPVRIGLQACQSELGAEGGRLGVHAVGPPDGGYRRELVGTALG